jgi:peptidase E
MDNGRNGAPKRRILAWGGHDFTSSPADRSIRDFMLGLVDAPRPRICLLPTASGDPAEQIRSFYNAFGDGECEPSDLSLFRLARRPVALRDHLLAQDLICVGGGSMVNLLAVWEAHEIAAMLALAWKQGVVLAGQSAGALCWCEAGITRSFGRPQPAAGLGLLPGSLCVHYHQEPVRRSAYLAAVGEGMPNGYGLDDYAGLLWEDDRVVAVLSARRGARVTEVRSAGAKVIETPVAAKMLPSVQADRVPSEISEFRRLARTGWLG